MEVFVDPVSIASKYWVSFKKKSINVSMWCTSFYNCKIPDILFGHPWMKILMWQPNIRGEIQEKARAIYIRMLQKVDTRLSDYLLTTYMFHRSQRNLARWNPHPDPREPAEYHLISWSHLLDCHPTHLLDEKTKNKKQTNKQKQNENFNKLKILVLHQGCDIT